MTLKSKRNNDNYTGSQTFDRRGYYRPIVIDYTYVITFNEASKQPNTTLSDYMK